MWLFQSTLSVRRATRVGGFQHFIPTISIHALRKESDSLLTIIIPSPFPFQSTLSVRRATSSSKLNASSMVFQSTLSVRRATLVSQRTLRHPKFQSTLSVRRATCEYLYSMDVARLFQSTLSVRRATRQLAGQIVPQSISIHALRKESDHTRPIFPPWTWTFQSTLSVRRATRIRSDAATVLVISIHALRKESDIVSAD